MSRIACAVDVLVPVTEAYDLWTRVESFSAFMEGIESVTRIDEAHSHWVGEIGGVSREWDAVITEQIPQQRIAWQSTSGETLRGIVNFEPTEDNETRVTLELEIEPTGIVESVADTLGLVRHRVEGDLDRFKGMAENRRPEVKP